MQRRFITGAVAVAAAALLIAAAGQASATPITPGGGTVADSEQVTATLTLTSANQQAMADFATAVATPGTQVYRHHLTRAQLAARFAAPASRVAHVSAWARAAGFSVVGLDTTGTRLTMTGTARDARAAFGTDLRRTVTTGVSVRVTTANPQRPAAIAPDVQAVTGLSQQVAHPLFVRPAAIGPRGPVAPRPAGAAPLVQDGQFCATYWAEWDNEQVPQKYPTGMQSNPICGYTGGQLRGIYGLGAGDTGAGQTVVIVGAYNSATAFQDANAAFAKNGVPPLAAAQYQVKSYSPPTSTSGCNVSDWAIEQSLDIESIHTIAPSATIVYAAAPDCTALPDTLAKVVSDDSLPETVISNSWGLAGEPTDTQFTTAVNNTLARAAILGIGVMFASGDQGDYSSLSGRSGPSVTFPASSPWATAVGGTTTAVGANGQVLWQTGWEDSGNVLANGAWQPLTPPFLEGAGGGSSQRFDKPSWQQGVVPGTTRALPDISALANPYTALAVGFTSGGTFIMTPVGGTSLAAPIIAGLVLDAQARAGSDSDVGFLAPLLYAASAAGHPVTADVQHQAAGIWAPAVSATSPRGDYLIDVDAAVQSLHTASGWDTVTGLGTPGSAFLTGITS